MNSAQALVLIAARLSGNISAEENETFEAWVNAAAANRQFADDAEKIWRHSTIRHAFSGADAEDEWQRLQARIARAGSRGAVRTFFATHALKIAAGLVLIAVAYWVLRPAGAPQTMLAAQNEVTVFYLPDSTKVWLNVGSTLAYTPAFGKEERAVALTGEGYFKVTPDSTRPFLVITQSGVTSVVGTAFNVKEDTVLTVTVAEGKVRLAAKDLPAQSSVLVEPGEKATIRRQGKTRPVKTANTDAHYAAWRMQNNPVFIKESKDPVAHLDMVQYTWKKNQINQSVIEGTLRNDATQTAFKNIVLAVTYTRPNGAVMKTRVTIRDTVLPGQRLEYRKSLLDFFSKTQTLTVKILAAEPLIDLDVPIQK